MIKVGLTGGIGSGKTTVALVFTSLGIPVFYADNEAKRLMDEQPEIKIKLKALFGDDIYVDGKLDRKHLASLIFNNKLAIENVNNIVHPAVANYFDEWCEKQKSPYVLQEAAILFETGGYKRFDKNILVTAPQNVRLSRIKERDSLPEEQIIARMQNQWDENHKIPVADFVILNDGSAMLLPQILRIHEDLLRLSTTKG